MFNLFKRQKIEKDEIRENESKETINVEFKYQYVWKDEIPTNERNTPEHPSRPFCQKLMELHRVYTRADIETISQAVGYSVFDRCGGDGCRHKWEQVTIIKKGDG